MMTEKALTLGQIALYNPQRLSDDQINKLFVVRTKLFGYMLDRLTKEKPTSIPQHYLFIAQRGMGKTTLLKRIEVELRSAQWKESYIPLLLPEEQYNLKSHSEFWLNCLDSLADTLETEQNKSLVKEIDNKIGELQKLDNNETLAKQAFQYLKTFSKTIGRRPVLLIDNMSFVFDRLEKSEQHKLRSWLMQNGAPIVIGASAVAIEDTFDYGAPFYDAFQIHHLNKLSFDELIEILNNLAKLTHEDDLLPTIQQHIARLKTIHQLTGGNPRTAVILFKLIVKGFSKEINEDLEALLDEVTPLYKARLEELPKMMQVIVDAIALHWDPINIEQLRTETRLENHQISPQLNRLREAGWIEKVGDGKTKGGKYQVSERFFNIWFLMRRSSRRQKKELYCLSRFLETLYGDQLFDLAKKRISQKYNNIDHIIYNIALSNAKQLRNTAISKLIIDKSLEELNELSKKDITILSTIKEINQYCKSELSNKSGNSVDIEWLSEIKRIMIPAKYSFEVEEQKLLNEIQLAENDILPKRELGDYYLISRRYIEAETIYHEIINSNKNDIQTWLNLGFLYGEVKKYPEAEKSFSKAIEIDNRNATTWSMLGELYKSQEDYQRAEEAMKKGVDLEKDDFQLLYSLGELYISMKNFKLAEKIFQNIINLDVRSSFNWHLIGQMYFIFEKYDKIEYVVNKLIEINPNDLEAWKWYGELNHYHSCNFEIAEKAYLKVIGFNKNEFNTWYNLGLLYHYHLQKYDLAEKAYLKTIGYFEIHTDAYVNLGILYHDRLRKYQEALSAYQNALKLAPSNNNIKLNLVFLYRDKLGKIEIAEQMLDTIEDTDSVKDTFWLNKALIELYKRNEGIAKDATIIAFEFINGVFPANTQDDWWRFAAVVTSLGYTKWLAELMKEQGYDIVLSPYFVAINALGQEDINEYLNGIAVEIREPAKQIVETIKAFM